MSRHELQLSVIVAARNAAGCLPRLLECLESQTLDRERFEVLVVDDCSTDETPRIVERSEIATLLVTPRRGGAYAARNVGLREARGEFIAFTDADCEPREDWLERAVADLDERGADLVGGRIEVPLATQPSVAEMIDFARYGAQSVEAGFAATANLVARRVVIDTIGEFNERCISGGDREFCVRATSAGFVLAPSPGAVIVHQPRRRARDLIKKTYRTGVGRSQLRAHGHGSIRDESLTRIWTRPGVYLIRPGIVGLERLEREGLRIGWARRRRLELGEYLWVQLPCALGSFVGSVRETARAVRGKLPPNARRSVNREAAPR